MRDLAIAYGNNRQAKKWVNKTIKYDDLKNRLKVTIRTTESAEEYKKTSKAQRDAAKDHGGFVGGVLKGGRRKIDTVEKRSMIALDGDRIDKAFLDDYENIAPYTSCLYTTHSSTAEEPRVRLVFPLTRDITSEEFVAVSRYIAQMLGIDYFDECSYQPNQLMYWPSSPQNGVFVFKEVDKAWLNPDDILSAHPEWTDPTQLPTSSRESKANQVAQQKVQDPLTKEGTVGLFNRAYFPVTKALDAFLSDAYEATDNENRYHLIESHSMAGVEIKDGKFVYSHHAKDPAYLKLCNAFDIVRTHKFSGLDDKESFREMCEFAMQQDEVKVLAANERLAEAEADFAEAADDDNWKTKLKYQPKTGMLENTVYNLNLILAHDPDFRHFAFNEMANRIQITGELPWERPEGNAFWRDADTAQLKSIIDTRYLPFSTRNHDIAFTKITDMTNELINKIKQKMQAYLGEEQMRQLHEALCDCLSSSEEKSESKTVDLIQLFLAAKRVEGCSNKTVHYYESTIRNAVEKIDKDVVKITTDDLRMFLDRYQEENNISKVTVDNIRRILSSFFAWLEDEDYIVKSPVRRIHKVKTCKTVKETYTDEALEIMRDECDGLRDLAMIDLLASTGMRVGELVKLNRDDIDFENRECVVLGKGNKQRRVYFDARTKLHLQKYLNSREDSNEALFVSLQKPYNRLLISGVEIRLRKLGEKLNLHKVHPHKFRRTLATTAIDKGMPIEQVQQLLGHQSIDTTLQYAMVNQNNVKQSHRKFIG